MKKLIYSLGFVLVFTLMAIPVKAAPKAPNFVLPDLDGNRVSLSQMKGHKVILLFFSHKQPLNVKTLKQLEIFQKTPTPDPDAPAPIIYAIETTSFPRQLKAFVTRNNISIPVLIDDFQVKTKYNAYAVPKLFLIDENGVIAWKKGGYVDAQMITQAMFDLNTKQAAAQNQ